MFKKNHVLAWMPDELSPAHNIWGQEVRSGTWHCSVGEKLCPNRSCSDQSNCQGGLYTMMDRWTCSYVHSPLLFLSKMLIVLVCSPCILKFFLQHRSHLLLLLLPACVQLSSICLMYWTFLCLMWQQCPSLLAVLWKHFRCRFFYLLRVSLCYAFVYVLHISVFAARFCNVLCCVVKLIKMFSYFACVLTTCMCFLKLLRATVYTSHTTLLWLVVGLSNWAKRHFFSWFGWNTPHNHSPMEQHQTHSD